MNEIKIKALLFEDDLTKIEGVEFLSNKSGVEIIGRARTRQEANGLLEEIPSEATIAFVDGSLNEIDNSANDGLFILQVLATRRPDIITIGISSDNSHLRTRYSVEPDDTFFKEFPALLQQINSKLQN